MTYQPGKIEPKWQKEWREKAVFQPDLKKARKPFYNLMMFPYPSAEGLHVGNMYAFTGADIFGRFKKRQGFSVFEPIGLDGFGIHSENYAIKIGAHPAKLAKKTAKTFYRQLEATGNGYAWRHTLETYDPDYYRWTQWLFVQMFKHGLAYRQKSSVNWCPSCQTVLADEQVIGGKCERCSTEVSPKELEQWFFKITKYADKLLKNLEWIDWSERIKVGQKNWIGKSEGVTIDYPLVGKRGLAKGKKEKGMVSCYSTRPDTNFGATFIVISPEHPRLLELVTPENKEAVSNYIKRAKKRSREERESEKEKSGVFTGRYALNQLSGRKMPLWVADFVVLSSGTGMVVGVPAHDQRDWEFAKKYKLPMVPVIKPKKGKWDYEQAPFLEIDKAEVFNSDFLNGLSAKKAIKEVIAYLIKKGWGKKAVNYHLRDWCVSRQRYWGPPIPMINCPACGWVSVPEKDLPVELPVLADFQPKGLGEAPLAQLEDWVKVKCPECGKEAKRETNVSDTFLDSAWYFLRYPSVDSEGKAFESSVTKKWLPVDMCIGGAEHTVLHLMYARFITMALHDFGLIDFEEPFKKFYAHGLIIKDGAKMSKSKGNVVIPDEHIKKFGADTLRCYLMFLGPFNQGGDFRDEGMAGIYRFLNRVWRLVSQVKKEGGTGKIKEEVKRQEQQTIKRVTEDLEKLDYNTALAALMEYLNFLKPLVKKGEVEEEAAATLVLLLAPFAPHIAEELWVEVLGRDFSVHQQSWPQFDKRLAQEKRVSVVVQVNGRVRGQVLLALAEAQKEASVAVLARKEANVKRHLKGGKIKKTFFVPGKLINFVVA